MAPIDLFYRAGPDVQNATMAAADVASTGRTP